MEITSISISDARYHRLSNVLSEALGDVNNAANGGDKNAGRSVSDCLISAKNDLNYADSYLIKMMQDVTGLKEELSFAALREQVAILAGQGNKDANKILRECLLHRDSLVTAILGADISFVPKVVQSIVEKPAAAHPKPVKVAREKSLSPLAIIGDWYYNLNSTKKKLGINLKGFVFSSWNDAGKLVRQVLEPISASTIPKPQPVKISDELTYHYGPMTDTYSRSNEGTTVIITKNSSDTVKIGGAKEVFDFSRLDMLRMQTELPFKSWRDMFKISSFAETLHEARAARQRGFSLDSRSDRRRAAQPGLRRQQI